MNPEEVESIDSYESESDDSTTRQGQYRELARIFSRQSSNYGPRPGTVRTPTKSTMEDMDEVEKAPTHLDLADPRLNPDTPEFNPKIWVHTVVREMQAQDLQHSRVGVVFRDLNVTGSSSDIHIQSTVSSPFKSLLAPHKLFKSAASEKRILRNFDGAINEGEMLVVLGRPGSGCSTFLKSLCGELYGLKKQPGSVIEYNGLDQETFKKEFRGEAVYNQEQENHFPHLTVGETLDFAAAARTPSNRLAGWTRDQGAKFMATLVMNIFGLSHTRNTKVGNDFVRGVSGGERKRVSIAEMALASSPFAAWDNSTRGLDSATALTFVRSLRTSSDMFDVTHAVAIYQASQSIYDLFDKAVVLYEGRQIFYGPASKAKAYFEEMGYYCPPRQTTGDFLTSVTNPSERQAKSGYEDRVPRTPDDFEAYWHKSEDRRQALAEVDRVQESSDSQTTRKAMRELHNQKQAKHMRPKSPYTISVGMQVGICTKRAWQRIWNDKPSTLSAVLGNAIMALIVASIYYGTPLSTSSFFSKAAIIFFAILLNALSSITEINNLYEQRPIVEKHRRYAFYHPAADAFAGIVIDWPIKFISAVAFNIVIYFLGGLTYEAGKFFIFFLIVFITTLSMSAVFRTMAAVSKTISQALAAAGVVVLAIVMYTGFTITPDYQHPWFFWLQYLNPVRFAYEALLSNELHGQSYECASIVPPYGTGENFACAVQGAVAGQRFVSGDAYGQVAYAYSYSHVWRNFGIVCAFLIFFYFTYLLATELNATSASTAEFLVFRAGHGPAQNKQGQDEEKQNSDKGAGASQEVPTSPEEAALEPHRNIFTWRDVTLDIMIKSEKRRLLDGVSGWVKPGTLTALMGTSGAGKTTLLDTLAQRMRVGVLTGDMLVNGAPLPKAFQRNTGYVQQQDLHLETTTVREALRFSAMLRRPKTVSVQEKNEFVEEVIGMLGMQEYAEAVVGNPGEGLNVEQRKMLTIGVELAAKPDLLLFLDEPTSGLDSQSSWSIIAFLRKLADSGQAILSTIHQPSAILFQEFDRLLFLAKGGKTVYFGQIGSNSETLLEYFSRNGARACRDDENPAEYMLEVLGDKDQPMDWPELWKSSQENKDVYTELDRIAQDADASKAHGSDDSSEYAMPLGAQIYHVTARTFQQYWRSPSYIYGKFILGVVSALFIGFSYYRPPTSQTGVQNLIFSAFMLTSIFSTLAQQIMPRFVIQRSLYEVRERPSKAYSWVAFVFANIVVEIPYHILLSVMVWASWYFPVYGANQTSEQMGLMLLFVIQFFVFTGTFAQMVIAGLPDAATAGTVATLLFAMSLTFNGVLATPDQLPGFWIFMYRVSPLTYFIGGWAASGSHGTPIVCTDAELATFAPPTGQTCGAYLAEFLAQAPGYVVDSTSTTMCQYCPLNNADQYLAGSRIYWSDRWRNVGIIFAYIAFNIMAATALYYLVRVKQWKSPTATFANIGKQFARAGRFVLRGRDDHDAVERSKRHKPDTLSRKKTNDRVY